MTAKIEFTQIVDVSRDDNRHSDLIKLVDRISAALYIMNVHRDRVDEPCGFFDKELYPGKIAAIEWNSDMLLGVHLIESNHQSMMEFIDKWVEAVVKYDHDIDEDVPFYKYTITISTDGDDENQSIRIGMVCSESEIENDQTAIVLTHDVGDKFFELG